MECGNLSPLSFSTTAESLIKNHFFGNSTAVEKESVAEPTHSKGLAILRHIDCNVFHKISAVTRQQEDCNDKRLRPHPFTVRFRRHGQDGCMGHSEDSNGRGRDSILAA